MSGERPRLRALPEVLVSMPRPGEFVFSNPLMRTHALGDLEFAALISALAGARGASPDLPVPEQCRVVERDRVRLFATGCSAIRPGSIAI